MRTHAYVDVIYVPAHLRNTFIEGFKGTSRYKLHSELLVPVIIDTMLGADQIYLSGREYYLHDRNPENVLSASQSTLYDYVHPLKLSRDDIRPVWIQLMDEKSSLFDIIAKSTT